MNQNTVTPKIVNSFGIAQFTEMAASFIPVMFISYFLTEAAGLTAAMMGTVLLISRVIDIFFSVMAGGVIQKTQMKWGQYRSWSLLTPIIVLMGNVLCFGSYSMPEMIKISMIIIGYCAVNCTMNFAVSANFGLIAKVSGADMQGRMRITGRKAQFLSAASLVCSATMLSLISIFGGADMGKGYFLTVCLFCLVNVAGQINLFRVTASYDPYNPNLKSSANSAMNVKFSQMFAEVFKSKPVFLVISAETLRNLAAFVVSSLNMYYFAYVIGDGNMLSISMTISGVVGLIGSIIMPKIALKIGKRNSAMLSYGVTATFYLLIALFGTMGATFYMAASAGAAFGLTLVTCLGPNMFMDAGECAMYKSGVDARGFIMSLFSLPMKIGMAISSVVVGYGLSFIGFETGMQVSAEFSRNISLLIGGVPALCLVLGIVLLMFYDITDEKAKQYAQANLEKASIAK